MVRDGRGGPRAPRRRARRRAAARRARRGRRRAAAGARAAAERLARRAACPPRWSRSRSCAGCSGAGSTRPAPPSADVEDLTLAASEACANAIEHAYGLAPGVARGAAPRAAERRRRGRDPRLRQLAGAARHAPRPRAAADGGADRLRRGDPARRGNDRRSCPGGWGRRPHERRDDANVDHRDSVGVARAERRGRHRPGAASCASSLLGAVRNDDLGLVVDLTRRPLHRQRRREPPVRAGRAAHGAPAALRRGGARRRASSSGC